MVRHPLITTVMFDERKIQFYILTILYYINTNEIPGELSRENLISSHVKISHLCYGYIINRAFHTKKLFKVKWFGISLVFI